MDFPVEATVHLKDFRDDTKVRELLRSHGFEVKDLRRGQVRVKGSFLKLKAVKAHLEQLLNRENQTEATPRPSSPVSSGAIFRYNADIRPKSAGDRGRLGSSDGPMHAHPSSPHISAPRMSNQSHTRQISPEASPRPSSPFSPEAISKYNTDIRPKSGGDRGRLGSSDWPLDPSSPHTSAPRMSNQSHTHQISPEHRAAVSPGARQCEAFRPRSEVFIVDADVFMYAKQFRNKDFVMILENHSVRMSVDQVSESAEVTLLGKNARTAAGKLQSLFNDLNKSLRTQEVPLRDMDQKGKALLERIRRNNNVIDSVLVCEMNDRLHLIGSSTKSYEVKQTLLGRWAEQSGRAGRTSDRGSGRRSSSLPPINRRGTDIGDSGGTAYSSPAGAAGYSPSNNQDDKQEGVQPAWEAGARPGPSGASRRRSSSVSRVKGPEEKPPGFTREIIKRSKPPGIKQALLNMNLKIKGRWKF